MSFVEDVTGLIAALMPTSVAYMCVPPAAAVPVDSLLLAGIDVWRAQPRSTPSPPPIAAVGAWDDTTCPVTSEEALGARRPCKNLDEDPSGRCRNYEVCEGGCANFLPGKALRHVSMDIAQGRTSCFAMRIEEVVARAVAPVEAVESALEVARSCGTLEAPATIDSHSIDLVVSVFASTRFQEEPYMDFEEEMTRRFGDGWRSGRSQQRVDKLLARLRETLLITQLEGHVDELARLVEPVRGCVYVASRRFVEMPGDRWELDSGAMLLTERLRTHFVLDGGLRARTAVWTEDSAPHAIAEGLALRLAEPGVRSAPARHRSAPPPKSAK